MKKKSVVRRSFNTSAFVQKVLVIIMLCWFVIFLLIPIIMIFGKVVTNTAGEYVGLENFKDYFSNPLLRESILHSLCISLITAVGSTGLGLIFAYGITRTNMKFPTIYKVSWNAFVVFTYYGSWYGIDLHIWNKGNCYAEAWNRYWFIWISGNCNVRDFFIPFHRHFWY